MFYEMFLVFSLLIIYAQYALKIYVGDLLSAEIKITLFEKWLTISKIGNRTIKDAQKIL